MLGCVFFFFCGFVPSIHFVLFCATPFQNRRTAASAYRCPLFRMAIEALTRRAAVGEARGNRFYRPCAIQYVCVCFLCLVLFVHFLLFSYSHRLFIPPPSRTRHCVRLCLFYPPLARCAPVCLWREIARERKRESATDNGGR